MQKTYSIIPFLIVALFACQQNVAVAMPVSKARAYYISPAGNDANNGNGKRHGKQLASKDTTRFTAGDTIYFEGGQIFNGSLFIDSINGVVNKPVVITSYGNGRAVINGGNAEAITLYKSNYVNIININFMGAGRKTGNIKDGVAINTCNNITIDGADISGFQKSGLLIYASGFLEVLNVQAHDNGFAGISISGDYGKHNCYNIHINNCSAANNPGDPTNLTNHSGNGIIAGYCKNITIENSTATNNGWDMPRTGNGPVGIWCFEADSVIIQHCISYANKTSKGGADGGGYDLDGGVTNSVIQYCLSYKNQGSGYGIFQYAGAGNWHNNVVRFNISEDDGEVSPAHAGIFIWNSSNDSSQFKNCLFYNNVVYNSAHAAVSYERESNHAGFKFYNNIFIGNDSLLTGKRTDDVFTGNNWYALQGGFNIEGYKDFKAWATANNQEQINDQLVGFNVKPAFNNPGHATITVPSQLNTFNNYQLPAADTLRNKGLNLQTLFGINNGGKAFNQNAAPANGMGACF